MTRPRPFRLALQGATVERIEDVRTLLEAPSPAVLTRGKPGHLLRLVPDDPKVWDLSGILPA